MPKKITVIGIGGTGMRCLESFVHMCAIGMFDDTTVSMLALDTDARNGNFARLRELVADYKPLAPSEPTKDTFFSANIKYYEFSPNYDNKDFNRVVNYNAAANAMTDEDPEVRKSDLIDLFLTPDQRAMNLEHGYRAQTQMGSLLMYRAIIEEAVDTRRRKRPSQLKDFINESGLGVETGQKVFIFGSVFGGTGASSIPVIPDALNKAAKIFMGESAIDILRGNYFGTVVLTNYFAFPAPGSLEDKVVAKSEFFSLNSQAALMFYEKDASIRNTYKRMYLIGRANPQPLPAGTKSTTGGSDQCNPADFIELLAVFAAYDFFNNVSDKDQSGEFLYMNYEAGMNALKFENFDLDAAKVFKKKFGSAIAAALTNARGEFFNGLVNKYYTNVDTMSELPALNRYFKRLLAMYNNPETGRDEQGGWAQQLAVSTRAQFTADTPFLLHKEVFDAQTPIKSKKYNERLFADEVNCPKFATSGWFGDAIYDKVRDTIQDGIKGSADKHTTLQQLIRDTYETFVTLYNI